MRASTSLMVGYWILEVKDTYIKSVLNGYMNDSGPLGLSDRTHWGCQRSKGHRDQS